jgi:hypothetical protein
LIVGRNLFPPGHPNSRDLKHYGPRLEVGVGQPILRARPARGLPSTLSSGEPKLTRVPAMIDTGAARTVLTPLAVRDASLSVVDYTKLARAGGIEENVPVHAASIHFPRYTISTIEVIQVLCCELPEQPIQCLIGRDVISRWLFTYDGRTGQWSIFEKDEDVDVWVEPPEELFT